MFSIMQKIHLFTNNSNSKDNSENHSCIQIVPQYALCNHSYHNDKKHCDMSFTALLWHCMVNMS